MKQEKQRFLKTMVSQLDAERKNHKTLKSQKYIILENGVLIKIVYKNNEIHKILIS